MSVAQIISALRIGKSEVYIPLIAGLSKEELEARSLGDTALSVAAECGQVDALKLLHSKGLDLNKVDSKGHAPIHSIMYIKDDAIRHACLDFLIEANVDLDKEIGDANRMTLAHLCIRVGRSRGYIETLLHLLYTDQLKVNKEDVRQETALDYAYENNDQMIPYLKEYGAVHGSSVKSLRMKERKLESRYAKDIAFRSSISDVRLLGNGPLHVAPGDTVINLGHVGTYDELVDRTTHILTPAAATPIAGAEKHDARQKAGETEFHLALKDGDKQKAIESCDKMPIPLQRDLQGNTIYHTAALHGRVDVLKRLFDEHRLQKFSFYPFLYHLKNHDNNTTLHTAILGGHVDTIVFVLNQNCDLGIPNKNGITALALLQSKLELYNQVKAATTLNDNAARALGIDMTAREVSLKRNAEHTLFKPAPKSKNPKITATIERTIDKVRNGQMKAETAASMLSSQPIDTLKAMQEWLQNFDAADKAKLAPISEKIVQSIEILNHANAMRHT